MTELPRPRAILFDWDNTLIDNWRTIQAALNAAFEAMGHPTWSLAETKARVRESLRDSFPRLFGDRWEEAREIFYRRIEADHLHNLRALAGADALLAELAKAGLYLGVVSNKNGSFLRREAEHLGWTPYFARLVGATDAPRDKPAPDPVMLALSGAGGPAAGLDVWFVGDAAIDMVCARAAGCTPILVGEADPSAAEFRDSPPHRHVPDLAALGCLVRGHQKTISRADAPTD